MNPTSYDHDVLRKQMEILRAAAATRARLEVEIAAEHDQAVTLIEEEEAQASASTEKKYAEQIATTKREYATELQRIAAQAGADLKKVDDQRKKLSAQIARQAQSQERKLKEDDQFEDSSSREVARERKKDPQRHFLKGEKNVAKVGTTLTEADARVLQFLAACGVAGFAPVEVDAAGEPVVDEFPAGADVLKTLDELAAGVVSQGNVLCGLPAARRAFSGGLAATVTIVPLVLGAALGGGALYGAQSMRLPLDKQIIAVVATFVVVLVVSLAGGWWWLIKRRTSARATLREARAALEAEIAKARRCMAACSVFLVQRRDDHLQQLEQRFVEETERRKAKLESRLADTAATCEKSTTDLEAKYKAAIQAIATKRDSQKEAADGTYPPRLAALEAGRKDDLGRVAARREERLAAATARRDDRVRAMTADWQEARTRTATVYDEANALDATAFPPWDELAKPDVPLPVEIPPGLRFGDLALTLEKVPGGVSASPQLNAFGPVRWTQPATVPFPVGASLLIKTTAEQKETASAMMQALTLRIFTGIPAGQSRFTIIDPLGLGKQFAGFMHLADHDELLVTSRIWTEPAQIEQRLADITELMEVVIQKYLRNEYESIGAYNAEAEVPEPYRFVVVANFPANFTETATRRLASIAASGARCGVYVILSIDTKQAMPSNFSLAEIEKHATTLVLKDGTFTWNDPEFSKWPLTVEQAPSDEVFTEIIQRVGKAAKAAKRVEVPFDRVAPAEEDWWKGSTASEVLAPLGPAGARKLQYIKLGKGTSQHVLIAGKTGSGKSTLMHAMITSLALQYSPNELQFYLIDFKKGVEFKLYDLYQLPHARVIAIESEREFGLSVLEQLDRELKRRGDLFRDLSVQDVAGFRQTGHPDPMPRILLLIDEFQEIFVEDDRLAQDAALILDRLVRQGRAFGMHVLLGSQTLGGSYSLPRATMGQMAVRIALQCNEADSSLILSEENTAARLLTRPGEAIYNDANGMVAGNNPFQVVFLNDERRERYLGALRRLADRRTDIPAVPRLVFDGNQAADPAGNRLLGELLASGTVHGHEPTAAMAWLGEAIAIKDPTAAIFRRQGGANLLIAGQREDLGTALLAMSIVTLASGYDPHPRGAMGRAARFVVFEPAIADEKPEWLLSQLGASLPHDFEVANRLDIGGVLERLAAEVQRRIDEQVLDGEAVFVVIRDLARFRELRKSDGDFGFSFGGEKKVGPAQHFNAILRDGPTVGIHTIIWCDSLTNLMRTFERAALKEFELRVLFQMSQADSSQLIDSPAAGKLGPQRALFIHEETGTLEKFRPYAFPSAAWLDVVRGHLFGRPQGTPASMPAAVKPAEQKADALPDGETFGLAGGFGEFNFTKMLDDLPGGDAPAAGDAPS